MLAFNKKNVVVVVVIFIVAMLIFKKRNAEAVYDVKPVSVNRVINQVSSIGTLSPAEQVSVGAQASGQLKSVNVKLGDYVKRGQLLAVIDPLIQRNELQNAEEQVNYIAAQKESEIAQLDLYTKNLIRQKALRRDNANSTADVENAISQVERSQASIKALDAQLIQASISVKTAKVNLNYTNIYSPLDGYITEIVSKEGQTVVSSQNAPTIMIVSDLDNMRIKAKISEADISKIKPLMKAEFSILSMNDYVFNTYIDTIEPSPPSLNSGGVESLLGTQNSAVYYNAILPVKNENNILKPMMTALVNIILSSEDEALTVPNTAIIKLSKSAPSYVYVLRENIPELRQITTGLSDRVNTQVLAGLKDKELVLVAPGQLHKDLEHE